MLCRGSGALIEAAVEMRELQQWARSEAFFDLSPSICPLLLLLLQHGRPAPAPIVMCP